MKHSWRLARLVGIDIDVHWSFSFVILWVFVQGAVENRDLQNIMVILCGVLLVFGCIILHELGHAFMALSLDMKVTNITLLPYGGLAQIQSIPDRPWYEFSIAIAGPIVNLAIGLILIPLLLIIASPMLLSELAASPIAVIDSVVISFFQHNSIIGLVVLLIVTNLILFAFNLIPALPMDGGRILRAVLNLFLSYSQATKMAMAVGFTVAAILMVLAFQRGSVGLLFIAVFILIGRAGKIP